MTSAAAKIGETAPTKRFLADALTSMLGIAGGQLVNLIAIPLLTRLYDPGAFGGWILFLAVINIIPTIATLRLDIAMVTAKTAKVAREVTLLTTGLVVVAGILMQFAFFAAEAAAGKASWIALHHDVLNWIPLGATGMALNLLGTTWWLRHHKYKRIAAAKIGVSIMVVAMQIALVRLPDGSGLIVASAIGQAMIGVLIYLMLAKELFLVPRSRRRGLRFISAVKRFRQIAIYTTPYSLQGQFFRYGAIAMIAAMAGLGASGMFAMAQRAVYMPLAVIASGLEQATYPRMARAPYDPQMHAVIARTMLQLTILAAAACAVATVFARPLTTLAFGPQWSAAAPYVVSTCYSSASLAASSWVARVFDIVGKQRLHLVVDASANLAILAAFGLVLFMTRDPVLAVIALAVGMTLYYAAWAVLAFSLMRASLWPLLKILGYAALTWCVVAIPCLLISRATGLGLAAGH